MEPSSVPPAIEFGEKSDPGRDPDKQVNEDACGYRATRFGHLCVVCDGMGGHVGGREASHLSLRTIFEHVDAIPADTPPQEVLRGALAEANRRVYAMSSPEMTHGRPGSTVVALLLCPDGTYVAHVGDSRCYMIHHGQIVQLTKDHSMVQELVDRGLLTPAQAAVHPDANMITRALGMMPEAAVDVRAQPVPHVAGDAFVLCSDGLSDLVEPAEILGIVGAAPPQQAAGQLVDLANARGGHDNITVQVIRARESARGHAAQVAPTVALTAPPIEGGGSSPVSAASPDRSTGMDPSPERLTEVDPIASGGGVPADARAMLRAPHAPGLAPIHAGPGRKGLTLALIFGAILVLAGIVVAAVALYLQLNEREHGHKTPAWASDASLTDVVTK